MFGLVQRGETSGRVRRCGANAAVSGVCVWGC